MTTPSRSAHAAASPVGSARLERPNTPVAYARPIDADDTNLASELERRFEEQLSDPVRPVEPDLSAGGLRLEMDELRGLLDAAFDEVLGRLGRLEERLGALVQRDTSSHAIETTLALLAEAIQDLRWQRTPATGGVPDPAGLEDRLDQLARAVEERFDDGRTQIDQSLAGVGRALRTLEERPAVVDIDAVEEAARRASLPNAADIANLRRDVAGLTDAVRLQDKGIGELRATLDWIKERLLLR
jgi:hypothetical protein